MQGDEAKQRLCECDAATGGSTARGGEQAETAVWACKENAGCSGKLLVYCEWM